MQRFKKRNPWKGIIAGIVILSAVFTFITQKQQKDKLDVYTGETTVSQEDLSQEKEQQAKTIETQIYTDDTMKYSLSIPKEWTQVVENDTVSFVHKASGSTLRLETYAYDPNINNVTSESISTKIAADGKTFVSFTRKGDSSYEVTYQDQKNVTYDYIEEVYWDRSSIIRIVCIFNDENYEKILPYYQTALASFAWDPQDEIPTGYSLSYLAADAFEFGYPDSWVVGTSSNAIVAMDNTTNASLTITMQDSSQDLSSLTATDMSQFVSQNKQNVMMNNFSTSDSEASATVTYIANNVQMTANYYLFYDGQHLFSLSVDYEKGTIDESVPSTCKELFRSFAKKEETAEN